MISVTSSLLNQKPLIDSAHEPQFLCYTDRNYMHLPIAMGKYLVSVLLLATLPNKVFAYCMKLILYVDTVLTVYLPHI